jgi:hypothetical protein
LTAEQNYYFYRLTLSAEQKRFKNSYILGRLDSFTHQEELCLFLSVAQKEKSYQSFFETFISESNVLFFPGK